MSRGMGCLAYLLGCLLFWAFVGAVVYGVMAR